MVKKKNRPAQLLVRKRWDKATDKDRQAIGKQLTDARRAARRKREAERGIDRRMTQILQTLDRLVQIAEKDHERRHIEHEL